MRVPVSWLREYVSFDMPVRELAELMSIGSDESVGFTRTGMAIIDRPTYAVIAKRRRAADLDDRRDILSLLLRATTEEGETARQEGPLRARSRHCR